MQSCGQKGMIEIIRANSAQTKSLTIEKQSVSVSRRTQLSKLSKIYFKLLLITKNAFNNKTKLKPCPYFATK